ncbi:MAG: hypothetical protein UW64_C0030G0014 [Microgenomates group bacterium GW2011_GWC1_44_37]|nr:MAG: hypothetical protein UW64_C0030G0014 [Microgenomates group bacterium GW2011_GWC1_44_37]
MSFLHPDGFSTEDLHDEFLGHNRGKHSSVLLSWPDCGALDSSYFPFFRKNMSKC